MGLLKEFKDFALRGNVIDMAVGVIIGGAFGKIVNSLVSDILMPPLGRIVSNLDFKRMHVRLFTESELAQAIANNQNPLTARVMVNRIWLHHFGAGLERTPSDFGLRGELPTHPDRSDSKGGPPRFRVRRIPHECHRLCHHGNLRFCDGQDGSDG